MNGVNDMAVGPGGFVPPNPGGGNGDAGGMPAAPRGLGQQPESFTAWHDTRRPHAGDTALAGNNPLVAAANPLLDLIPQIRATGHHSAPRNCASTSSTKCGASRRARSKAASRPR